MHPALLGLFILEAILYGLIAYVLLRKRTPYPGYPDRLSCGGGHGKPGGLGICEPGCRAVCGGVGTVLLAAGLLLWRLEAGLGLAIGALLLLSILGAVAGVFLPLGLLRRKGL